MATNDDLELQLKAFGDIAEKKVKHFEKLREGSKLIATECQTISDCIKERHIKREYDPKFSTELFSSITNVVSKVTAYEHDLSTFVDAIDTSQLQSQQDMAKKLVENAKSAMKRQSQFFIEKIERTEKLIKSDIDICVKCSSFNASPLCPGCNVCHKCTKLQQANLEYAGTKVLFSVIMCAKCENIYKFECKLAAESKKINDTNAKLIEIAETLIDRAMKLQHALELSEQLLLETEGFHNQAHKLQESQEFYNAILSFMALDWVPIVVYGMKKLRKLVLQVLYLTYRFAESAAPTVMVSFLSMVTRQGASVLLQQFASTMNSTAVTTVQNVAIQTAAVSLRETSKQVVQQATAASIQPVTRNVVQPMASTAFKKGAKVMVARNTAVVAQQLSPKLVAAIGGAAAFGTEALFLAGFCIKDLIEYHKENISKDQLNNRVKTNTVRAFGSGLGASGGMALAAFINIANPLLYVAGTAALAFSVGKLAEALILGKRDGIDEKLPINVKIKQFYYQAHEKVQVTCKVPPSNENNSWFKRNDWIGLFRCNEPQNDKYILWEKIEKKSSDVSRITTHLTLPDIHGKFEFRYLMEGKYVVSGRSQLFVMGPQIKLISSLLGDVNNTSANDMQIQVEISLQQGEWSSYDWIGLYSIDTVDNHNYIESKYVPKIENGIATVNFSVPKIGGTYQVRYFTKLSSPYFDDIARSFPLQIPSLDFLKIISVDTKQVLFNYQLWSQPPHKYDWIALCGISDPVDTRGWAYCYINESKIGGITVDYKKIPNGLYELRYYVQHSYKILIKSEPFPIQSELYGTEENVIDVVFTNL